MMCEDFLGTPIGKTQHTSIKAKELASLIASERIDYVRYIESRQIDGFESVVLTIQVEVGQHPVYDIQREEIIAVKFDITDNICPEVLALRKDFPLVPHIHLTPDEYPRNLCLYDEPYQEVNLRWTPTGFLNRLSIWLRDTAEGTLHRQDQALEPLFMNHMRTLIINPEDINSESPWVSINLLQDDDSWPIGRVIPETVLDRVTHCLFVVTTPPLTHGIISRIPQTFCDLHQYLSNAGVDLIEAWSTELKKWRSSPNTEKIDEVIWRAKVIIILQLPKKRTDNSNIEDIEYVAFICESNNLIDIGEDIGVWEIHEKQIGWLLLTDTQRTGKNIQLLPANCMFTCERDALKRLSNIEVPTNPLLMCIGVGALGSQVLLNLARMGIGLWTIVDYDVMLPHNVGRHALTADHIGKWKAVSMANVLNGIMLESAVGIPSNVLLPGEHNDALVKNLENAEAIIDMSTSIAVARWLGIDCKSHARRVSLFINPAGTDLILLAEDTNRQITLDCLEMQYYRHLVTHMDQYEHHLTQPYHTVRYGHSCRDMSARIPQDVISLMAGIGSHALQSVISNPQAKIAIWRSSVNNYSVIVDTIPTSEMIVEKIGEWTLVTDSVVTIKAFQRRCAKLPCETGGVIVGSFDTQRKRIYIVDILTAPPDSIESPTMFQRGHEGLPEKCKKISEVTAGYLNYIGEWHSHPSGCSCTRSQHDCTQCNWIAYNMKVDGLPGLMMIINDDCAKFYLEYETDETTFSRQSPSE